MTGYATLAQTEAYITDHSLDGEGFPANAETNLSRMIDAATKTIDLYIASILGRPRVFSASVDTTRTFNVLDKAIGKVLSLGTDLCSVTSVRNDGTLTTAYKLLSPPQHPNTYTQVKLLTGSWDYTASIYPDDAASITGKFAYSATPPDDIVQACIQLAAAGWRQRHTTANVQAVTMGADGTLIFPDGLPKSVVDLLQGYLN